MRLQWKNAARKIRDFSYIQHCILPLQPHASNAARVNDPLVTTVPQPQASNAARVNDPLVTTVPQPGIKCSSCE